MTILLLALPLYILADAIAQGKLNLINRQFVPMTAQKDVNLPLHILYPICYVILALVVALALHTIYALFIAVLLRIALFDVILNITKKDTVFSVGTSATTDKLINSIGKLLRINPSVLNAIIKLLAIVASVAIAFYL